MIAGAHPGREEKKMASAWLAPFNDIPWSRVLGMAPSLAERARKLWQRQPAQEEAAAPATEEAVSAVEVRLHRIERRVAALQEEAVSSFEVVRAITEQHSDLVRAVDELLARTQTLLRVCVVLALGLVTAIALAVTAHMR